MIEAEEVENGGVPVVDVNLTRDRFVAVVVSFAVRESAFHAAASHPNGVTLVVVIAAVCVGRIRRATEFSAPDHEGVLEEITLFQVGEEPGDGFVRLRAVFAKRGFDVGVLIPGTVAKFNETDAGLGKAAGEEALAAEAIGRVFVDSVEREGLRGLVGEVHHAGHGGLHPEGEFVALDGAFDQRRMDVAGEFFAVQGVDEIDFAALLRGGEALVADLVDAVVVGLATAHDIDGAAALAAVADGEFRALIGRGEEGAAVVLRAAVGGRRIDGDEAGQVLVLRAKAVEGPRAEGRSNKLGNAGVHLDEGLRVARLIALHAAQQAEFVGVLGDVRKRVADPQAALAALFEVPKRRHQLGSGVIRRLSRVGEESRLIIEGVEMRRASSHAQKNDPLGPRREVRLFGRKRRVASSC